QRAGRSAPVAGYADGGERATVIAVADGQHLVTAAVLGGQHQRGLVGLGPRVGEEDLGVRDAGQFRDPLGELDLAADQVQRGGVQYAAVELLAYRVVDFGDPVPQGVGQDAREEVQIAATFRVGHPPPTAMHDLNRFVVVQRQPAG